jgi:hypothetical protein
MNELTWPGTLWRWAGMHPVILFLLISFSCMAGLLLGALFSAANEPEADPIDPWAAKMRADRETAQRVESARLRSGLSHAALMQDVRAARVEANHEHKPAA